MHQTDRTFTHHPLGVKDSKGREIGARIGTFETTLLDPGHLTDASGTWRNNVPAGTYYGWIGDATRGGQPYGASQNTRHCTSAAERDAAIEKYLKAARARAQRNPKFTKLEAA